MRSWEFPITSLAFVEKSNGSITAQIEKVSELIEAAYDEGRFVFISGNGGSGANASHLCEDLAKCTFATLKTRSGSRS